jgi:high-affinity nickel-transport protein
VVALAIGTIEVLQVMSTNPGLRGGGWDSLNSLDFGTLGYALVVLFIIVWAVSVSVWKVRRIEDRWNAMLTDEPHSR